MEIFIDKTYAHEIAYTTKYFVGCKYSIHNMIVYDETIICIDNEDPFEWMHYFTQQFNIHFGPFVICIRRVYNEGGDPVSEFCSVRLNEKNGFEFEEEHF